MIDLKDGQAALVWDEEEGFVLVLPKEEENALLPTEMAVLAALFVKLTRDSSYGEELVKEYFTAQALH